MRKRYWILGLVFILMTSLGYLIYRLNYRQQTTQNTLDYFPNSLAALVRVNNVADAYKKLNGRNLLWADLINIPFWNQLDRTLKRYDSLTYADLELKQHPIRMMIGFYASSDTTFDELVAVESEQKIDLEHVSKIVSLAPIELLETYMGIDIYKISSKTTMYAFGQDHICFFSLNKNLVKQSIQHHQQKQTLSYHGFKTIQKMSASDADMNVFIQQSHIDILGKQVLKESNSVAYKNFGQWLLLDIALKPNVLGMSGFLYENQTNTNSFIHSFYGQKPLILNAFQVLPKSTFFSYSLVLSNFGDYQQNSNVDLNSNPKAQQLSSYIENECTFFAFKNNGVTRYSVALKANDLKRALAVFPVLGSIDIWNTGDTMLLKHMIRDIPFQFPSRYVSFVGDYLIFGSDLETIEQLRNDYQLGTVLSKDEEVQDFLGHFSNTQNVFIYFKAGSNLNFLEPSFTIPAFQFTNQHDYLFQKMAFVGIQCSYEKEGLMYINMALRYSKNVQKTPYLLWEFKPESEPIDQIFVFENHNTNLKELFFQDQNHKIYLTSTTGQLLWKMPLEEPIVGSIYQVDAFKNKKFQLLFATSTKLYLIDRNGKNVKQFPITLKSKTKLGIQLMDYEKNKDYRLLVPTEDGMLYNYKIDGRLVDGWLFKKLKKPIAAPMRHVISQGRDYISIVDHDGLVSMIDRKGQIRLSFNQLIKCSQYNNYDLVAGQDLSKTRLVYSDETGNIHILYFNQKEQILSFKNMQETHFFDVFDVNRDQKADYMLSDEHTIQIFDEQKNILFDYKSDVAISSHPKLVRVNDLNYIAFVSRENAKTYILNTNGVLAPGFPLEGRGQVLLTDINHDKIQELITITQDGLIRIYTLDELKGY